MEGKGKGLDKEHTATNAATGESVMFTQRQWKDKAFRDDLKARGFERPEDVEEVEDEAVEIEDAPEEGEVPPSGY